MNKLKVLGLTALAGSLAAVSAQAGELSANGSANMTYKVASGAQGSGLGTDKGITFSGSGELDNGWSVSLTTYLTDAMGLSSHSTALTMGGLGTIKMGQGYGSVAAGFDEEVPQAYEQLSDHQNTAANMVGSWMDNGGIMWASPSFDTGAGSLSISIGLSPDADDTGVSNGGTGGHSGTYGTGMDVGVKLAMDNGLTLGVYGAERENIAHVPVGSDGTRDEFNGTWFATYSAGPVSIGYQTSYYDAGVAGGTVTAATTAKTIGTSDGIFEDTQMSISFNVNDDLSISYTEGTSTYDAQDNASTAIADVDQDNDALQIAYSMGGMSISAYMMSATNPGWDSDAKDQDTTEINLSLAF